MCHGLPPATRPITGHDTPIRSIDSGARWDCNTCAALRGGGEGSMLKSIVAGAALLTAAAISSHAIAAPLYDYLDPPSPTGDSARSEANGGLGPLYASFFTGGSSFTSINVELLLSRDVSNGVLEGNYYLAVYGDIGTAPDTSVELYKGVLADATLPNTPSVKSFSFAVSLAANERYWISLGSANIEGLTQLVWHFLSQPTDGLVADESYSNAAFGTILSNDQGAYQMRITGGEVPLPAALPLFATVLAGSGLIAWRRKRKAARLAA